MHAPPALLRGAPPQFDLDERLDMLKEVEPLVGCRGPEALAGIGNRLPAAGLSSIEYGAALLGHMGGLVMTRS